jgi:site-specific recombinase XerD
VTADERRELTDPLSLVYLDWCTSEGEPHNTVKARRRLLSSVGNAGTATREQVEEWWHARSALAPASRQTDLALLRSFYKWALTWDHRTDDPSRRIKTPKVPRRLPHPISKADLKLVLDSDIHPFDRRAVLLGAYLGVRVGEAARLAATDFDLENHRVRVFGKGAKERLVGLSPILLDELLPFPTNMGNIVTEGGVPFTENTLQRRVNRAIRAAGVPDATYHWLRHRFGTVALAKTGDLIGVSRAMGHY